MSNLIRKHLSPSYQICSGVRFLGETDNKHKVRFMFTLRRKHWLGLCQIGSEHRFLRESDNNINVEFIPNLRRKYWYQLSLICCQDCLLSETDNKQEVEFIPDEHANIGQAYSGCGLKTAAYLKLIIIITFEFMPNLKRKYWLGLCQIWSEQHTLRETENNQKLLISLPPVYKYKHSKFNSFHQI